MEILTIMFKIFEKGYRNYYRLYYAVRTNKGVRKIYESKKGCYILFDGKRKYIELP